MRTREPGSDPRADPRAERRAERRAQLLEAARDAIRAGGPGTPMAAIAAAGGVTKPVLYKHVGDREGLVSALAEGYAEELAATVAAALAAEVEPRRLLVATLDAYLSFVEREPQLYAFLAGTGSGPFRPDDRMVGLIPRIARDITLVIAEHLRDRGRDTGLAEPWAYALVGMSHTCGDWWLQRGVMSRKRLVEALATLVWDGLQAQDRPEGWSAPTAVAAD